MFVYMVLVAVVIGAAVGAIAATACPILPATRRVITAYVGVGGFGAGVLAVLVILIGTITGSVP